MMGAPSLVQISRRACIKAVKRIKDVGLAPYDLIRPILQKIENPYQLHELELNSPHLTEHDAELWREFIKRDIPFWAEITLPKDPDYDVYCALREQAANEVDEDAERMKQALLGLNQEKQKHSSKFVDPKKMGLPQEKPTSAQRYAVYDRMVGGFKPEFVLNMPKEGSKGLTPYSKGSRWKIEKPKIPSRAAPPKKSGLPTTVRRKDHLSIPTHRLNGMASGVVKAPRSFIEDYKVERDAAKRPPPRNIDNSSSAKKSSQTSNVIVPGNMRPITRKPQSTPTKPTTTNPESSEPQTTDHISNTSSSHSSASRLRPDPLPQRYNSSPSVPQRSPGDNSSTQPVARKPGPRPSVPKKSTDSLFIKPKRGG